MLKNVDINMYDDKDKELLKSFSKQIKAFQIDKDNYVLGFYDRKIFEIVRIKGNIDIISQVLEQFQHVIINVPITGLRYSKNYRWFN